MGKWGIVGKITEKQPSLASAGSGFEDQKFEDMIYWGIIIASIIGIIVIAGFIVLNQNASTEQNAFTAIFFGDYNKDISGGTANFSFAIENHEGKATSYTADINFDSVTVKTIEISLEKDQNYDTNISLPFNYGQRIAHKISVSLRNRKESIHYWTNVKKDYEILVQQADFNYTNGIEQATEDWTESHGSNSGSTAKMYTILKENTSGEYLKVDYSIDSSSNNDYVFIAKELSQLDSSYKTLEVTTIAKNAPKTFWIKLTEKGGAIYRYNLLIDGNTSKKQILLNDFLLAPWTKDENNKLTVDELTKIELGFEDPKLTAKSEFFMYFTGLKFTK